VWGNSWRARRNARAPATSIFLGLLTLLSTSCASSVDLATRLRTQLVATGWLDAGPSDGQNKIVPALSFQLTNASDQTLAVVQVNAVFRREGDGLDLGTGFVTAAGSNGLAPGASTRTLTVASLQGYTGTEARADMLSNSHFVDARVILFAKYGSTQWARLGEYPIARQLFSQ